ncbi:MAG: type I 3-dehydroquinate dehydratase [Syntrophorhabdales bacterium]|jgi:3-dehydroquinate dehydratase type I
MICVSLAEESVVSCLAALEDVAFAEIRLDRMGLDAADVRTIFSRHPNLIATCSPGALPDATRGMLLLAAIDSGAAYVDVELDAPDEYREDIVRRARSAGCAVIVSFHDHAGTPEAAVLRETVGACFAKGADIAKIACAVRSKADNARLLGLLDDARRIVVVGMGRMGRVVRLAAPLLGSPFTFACLAEGKETADGQIDQRALGILLRALASGEGTGAP